MGEPGIAHGALYHQPAHHAELQDIMVCTMIVIFHGVHCGTSPGMEISMIFPTVYTIG